MVKGRDKMMLEAISKFPLLTIFLNGVNRKHLQNELSQKGKW